MESGCKRKEYSLDMAEALYGLKSSMDLKTLHLWHILILSSQFPWTSPWHTVPLMNQQRCPLWYSQAGHFSLVSEGQSWRSQQGFLPYLDSFMARRNRDCLWTWVGMFLQPCSKLWIALRETAKSWAISLWDFPNLCRIFENSSLFITLRTGKKTIHSIFTARSWAPWQIWLIICHSVAPEQVFSHLKGKFCWSLQVNG